jgi:hypothetical protein
LSLETMFYKSMWEQPPWNRLPIARPK